MTILQQQFSDWLLQNSTMRHWIVAQMLTPTTDTTKYKQHKKTHGSIFTIKK
jgi:hypothetical protein